MSSIQVGSIVTWHQQWPFRESEQLTGVITGINAAAGRATIHVEGRAGIYTPSLSVVTRCEAALLAQVAHMPLDDAQREDSISDLLRNAGCHQ